MLFSRKMKYLQPLLANIPLFQLENLNILTHPIILQSAVPLIKTFINYRFKYTEFGIFIAI